MGTRLLAGLSLVAIVATACSGAAAPPQAEPQPSPIVELHMVSATDGWARTESSTLTRTTDGGHTWRSVEHCPVEQLLAVGTDEFWAAGGPDPDGDMSVCHTTDGGATWQTSTLHVDPDATIAEITAPDAHDVWIESAIPQGMHSDALIGLYRSTDTGKTSHEGSTIALFTTDDAGHTWDVRDAPPAPPDAQPALDVVSPRVVLVSVTGTTMPTLTETMDAGHTWANVPLPPTDGTDDWTPDFVSANIGFLSDNTAIEVTTVAGRHWQSISPVVLK